MWMGMQCMEYFMSIEKVKKSRCCFHYTAIPVTQTIKDIVDLSKTSRLICPYIVHRKAQTAATWYFQRDGPSLPSTSPQYK
ncbi:hypothetical protein OK016_16380 [Vibrio chagasii]|nr:hypothetical protein [Vibrio chagasii]